MFGVDEKYPNAKADMQRARVSLPDTLCLCECIVHSFIIHIARGRQATQAATKTQAASRAVMPGVEM